MSNGPPPAPLAPDVAQRLIDFARACKAATRTVTLYPDGHPAIVGALSRLVTTPGLQPLSGCERVDTRRAGT